MCREQPEYNISRAEIRCNIFCFICCICPLFIVTVGLNCVLNNLFEQLAVTTQQQYLLIPANTTYIHSISLDWDYWKSYEVSYSLVNGTTSETSVNFMVVADFYECYPQNAYYDDKLIKITKECYLMDNYDEPPSCYILRYKFMPDVWDIISSQNIKISCNSSSKQAIYAVWKLIPMEPKKHKNDFKELNFDCPSDWDTAVNYQECTSQAQITVTTIFSDTNELLVLRFCAGSGNNDLVMTYSASYNQTWIPYTSYYSDGCSRYRITSEETKVSIPLPLGHVEDNDDDDDVDIYISAEGNALPIELKVEYTALQNILFDGDIANFIVTCLAFFIFTSFCCLMTGRFIYSKYTK